MLTNHGDLIRWMKANVHPGDIVEIGTFMGDGAAQFALAFPDREIYTVDILDIGADQSLNDEGISLSAFYAEELRGSDQLEAIEKTIGGIPSVHFIPGDSRKVKIPCDEIWFTLIDGSHDAEIVRSDFWRVWDRSYYVAFHDYATNLAGVTNEIDRLAETKGVKVHPVSDYMVFEHDN